MRAQYGLLVSLLVAGTSASAQPLHQYADLALAPAGDRVASVESAAEPDAPQIAPGVIVVRAAGDGHVLATLDPCHSCGYSGLSFGPAGQLAFVVRDKAAGTATLMVQTPGARAPRRLATVHGLAAMPRWSADGTRIALLVTIGARKETGATQAGIREVGEIGQTDDEQRIAIVPATGGALRIVSPADRFVYEYDWLPDGGGFVATTAPGNGDANWWVATIDAIDIATGGMRRIAQPATQVDFPRVSPDGRSVAFIGGLMSDYGSVGGDVWTVPLAGGVASDITPHFKGSFTSLAWTASGLRATALIGSQAVIVPIDPARGAGTPLWTAAASLSAADAKVAFARTGTIATVTQDFDHGPAIVVGPPSAPKQISHDNDGFAPIVAARSLTWQSGGSDVQGWLVAPRGAYAPSARAPMITVVHGGPAAATVPTFIWQGPLAGLVKAGYWVFFPNPRGSYGQGEAFTVANRRDFGGGDLRDILAGIDAAEAAAPIDDSRLGMMGGSYGGFMSMWANTQTHRFKAIVAAAGLSDWISYYGTNGINAWMIPYFGKSAYDDPQAYWDISAIRTIKQARTPTLITVGERDIEVPPSQSVEYWNGLKAAGVATSLIIYPDEGHGIRAPEHVADARQRTIAWFDRYLKGQ